MVSRKVLLVGGYWNNDSNAGVGYQNANNTSSNSNRNAGSQLELTATEYSLE